MEAKPKKEWTDPVTGLKTAYKSMKGQHLTETEFVEKTEEETTVIAGILYLDFETFPQPVNEVPQPPVPTPDDGYPEEKSFEPMEIYTPHPFDARQLSTKATYLQVVNWCEIQHEDKDGVLHTYTFTNLTDTFNFITKPEYKDFIAMAHCGGRFDFQLLYEHYLSSEVMRQGHQKEPLMKGQKIMGATLIHNIHLLDSYNFVSKPLSALPATFGIQDASKGDFPHLFNQPKFQNYKGPIPALEWYDPDTKTPKKRQELLEWHAEQVSKEVIFDFQEKMRRYCSMDVTVLWLCMDKF